LQKEGEKLEQEAKSAKEKVLAAQAQLNDAQALAAVTKAEADKLRKEAEDAEIKVASAASMQQSQPVAQPAPAPVQQQMHPTRTNGGTNGFPPQYSSDPWGMDQSKPNSMGEDSGGFGEPLGGHEGQGFNSAAMGSGGFSIPAPPGANDNSNIMGAGGYSIPAPPNGGGDDPYSNPFDA